MSEIDKNTMPVGQKIERIRRLKGMKQDTLAAELGISRQLLSKWEQSDKIEDKKLEQIAKILGVSMEGLKHFDEEAAINNINTFHDQSAFNFKCQINSAEKWIEILDANRKLYEDLLNSEREKVAILKAFLKDNSS